MSGGPHYPFPYQQGGYHHFDNPNPNPNPNPNLSADFDDPSFLQDFVPNFDSNGQPIPIPVPLPDIHHPAQAARRPTFKVKLARKTHDLDPSAQAQAQAQLQVQPDPDPDPDPDALASELFPATEMPSTRSSGRGTGIGEPRRSGRHSGPTSYQEPTDFDDFEPKSEPEEQEQDQQDANRQADADEPQDDNDDEEEHVPITNRRTRSGRVSKPIFGAIQESSDSDSDKPAARSTRRTNRAGALDGFVAADDEDEVDDEGEWGKSNKRSGRLTRANSSRSRLEQIVAKKKAQNSRGRRAGSAKRKQPKDDDFEMDDEETPDEGIGSADEDALDLHSDEPEGSQGRSYSFRERKKVNYTLVAPPAEPARDGFGRVVRRGPRNSGGAGAFELNGTAPSAAPGLGAGLPGMPLGLAGGRGKKGKEGWDALPLSMSGKDYAAAFGDPVDSSDEELQQNAMRKAGAGGPALLGGSSSSGLLGAGGVGPAAGATGTAAGGLTGSGGTDSFGRVKKGGDAMADVDPLGVDMNIDFDSVGGLDHHIQQLKEMVTLPLLYPELFQRFKVTPPRGVLFHGPPGTGKTLVARALAASCSTEGQQISFFMRKGADCLSKWVGEAERQLRLLFEEARNSQPSIIFFDEIDGLAPVRSSKQDQIHASIVSTMLALMDGMDGRGQVVVIGATNRPDSVDPALRRPGRFDREFYFPLPSKEARKSIIDIHTKKWQPPLEESFKLRLAEVTKGYGGADLRALCTEAALNAIQRRYPQIYSTTDRLLLDPESIQVDAKDFMMSVNKIVPSSARSTASAAAPLPERLQPLLGDAVKRAIAGLDRVLPPVSKRNPLEEALWEDDAFGPSTSLTLPAADMLSNDRGFGREMLLQSFEAQRVFRPRMLIHGDVGMGQAAVGSALLQHLEGYHVQSLDIGTLMGDSARTPEAAVVQLFVEAKRHKPSVIFIPGLVHWADSVSESVKTTFKALLDGLAPSDPILLLAIAEGPLSDLEPDVKAWFGYLDQSKVKIPPPNLNQREAYFREIFDHVARPPTEFPDALPRRRRKLEELPKAPPRPPRQLTEAEIQIQAENDAKLLEHLKFRLGPVLAELRKKFKKFTREVWDEYDLRDLTERFEWQREKGKYIIKILYNKPPPGAAPADESVEVPAAQEADADADADAAGTGNTGNGGGHEANGTSQPEAETVDADADVSMQQASAPQGEVDAASAAASVAPVPETAAVNGINGDAAAAAAAAAATAAVPEEGTQTVTGESSELPPPSQANGTVETTEQPCADDDSPYIVVDTTLWTMNLEKMQKKLYYNGYFTVGAFLEDLAKIVHNADEAASVDGDRQFRAHQMRNLAIVLLDQWVDAAFRAECDRMAARAAARKAEAEASAAAAAAAAPEPAKGERQSARVQGREPEISDPVDIAAIERGHKRARSQPQDGGDDESKRIRLDDQPGPQAEEKEVVAAAPAPAPAPVHPPFQIDRNRLADLSAYILAQTANFSIEQLEQMRAAAFNLVWTHRSEWNRGALLRELHALFDAITTAVSEERRARISSIP